jgi:hypothetical protein
MYVRTYLTGMKTKKKRVQSLSWSLVFGLPQTCTGILTIRELNYISRNTMLLNVNKETKKQWFVHNWIFLCRKVFVIVLYPDINHQLEYVTFVRYMYTEIYNEQRCYTVRNEDNLSIKYIKFIHEYTEFTSIMSDTYVDLFFLRL